MSGVVGILISAVVSAIAILSGNFNIGHVDVGMEKVLDTLSVSLISQIEAPVDVYEILWNKDLRRLVSNLGTTDKVYVSMYSLNSTALLVTVPNIPDIKYYEIPIIPNSLEYVFPSYRPQVKRNNQVQTFVNYSSVNYGPSKLHPYVRLMQNGRATCMAAKFRSLSVKSVDMWYDDGSDGVLSATLRLGQETTTNTYEGHEFYFTEHISHKSRDGEWLQSKGIHKKGKEIARFRMASNQVSVLYIIMIYSMNYQDCRII